MNFVLADGVMGDPQGDAEDPSATFSFTLPPSADILDECSADNVIRLDAPLPPPSSGDGDGYQIIPEIRIEDTTSFSFYADQNGKMHVSTDDEKSEASDHTEDTDSDSIDHSERLEKQHRLSQLFNFDPVDMNTKKRLSRASISATIALPSDRKDSVSSHRSECATSDDEFTTSFTMAAPGSACGGPTPDPEYTPPPEDFVSFEGNLDTYERLCTLGTGTFGRVFLIREKGTKNYSALKMMAIRDLVESKQTDHVFSEKRILSSSSHPFTVKLLWTYKDTRFLYMNFEFAPGGELFAYLRNTGRFPVKTARFYTMETLLVLEYLHKRKIAYRDLKPENLLLAEDGHLIITDFGFAKKLTDRFPPFYGAGPLEIYDKILNSKPKFPRYFDLVAKDLCKKLLNKDRTKRLGSMKSGVEDVKNHKFFTGIDWEEALMKGIKSPIVPTVYYPGDVGNFDEYEEDELWDKIRPCKDRYLELFADW